MTVPGTQSEQIPELSREKQQQSTHTHTHTKEKYNKASPIRNKEYKSVKKEKGFIYESLVSFYTVFYYIY